MIQKIKETAKGIAALIGALITAGSTLIPAEWSPWLSLLLAVATAVATWSIPNAEQATGEHVAVADIEGTRAPKADIAAGPPADEDDDVQIPAT